MTTSYRPYLVRAIYEWAVDNDLTPMLLAFEPGGAAAGGVAAKEQFTAYNIAPQAVRDLAIDADGVRFLARFQGVSKHVAIDIERVVRIYCRETDEGLSFSWDGQSPEMLDEASPEPAKPAQGRPHLRLVSTDEPKSKKPEGSGQA